MYGDDTKRAIVIGEASGISDFCANIMIPTLRLVWRFWGKWFGYHSHVGKALARMAEMLCSDTSKADSDCLETRMMNAFS